MANDPTPPLPSHDFDHISALGKYKIQRKVGSGGMGAVYLAVDQQLKRTVALKVLPKDKASNQVLVRRFKAEGQAGAQMEHPNIVAVYESGEIDGYLYLAMEFVEGLDAFDLLRKRGVIPVKRSLEIIKQVTLALQHAFERQVVHRDIKPSNLMIRERDGVVKLADLGLARIIEDDGESGITKAGTTVGTVDYMSPEQGKNSKAADIRSDIYSLGCTWYHLLTGKAPYPEGDLLNKLRAHALQPVPDPRNLNENIPAGVVAVLQRMMAKKPEDRYQTPAQLLADLSAPALLRGDFSADQLQLLGAAHAGSGSSLADDAEDGEAPSSSPSGGARRNPGSAQKGRVGNSPPARSSRVERADDEDDEGDEDDDSPSPTGGRPRRPASAKPSRAGGSTGPRAGRVAGTEDFPEDEDDAPASPQKTKGKSRQPAGRESLPARLGGFDAAAAETNGGGKKAKTERVLPSRLDQPLLSEPPAKSIDPNHLKLVLLVLIVAVVIGSVFVVIKRFGAASSSDSLSANPYATGEAGVVPPPVTPGTPQPNANPAQAGQPQSLVASDPPAPGTGSTVTITPPPPGVANPIPADLDRTPFGGVIPFPPTGSTGQGPLPPWVWQARVKAAANGVLTIRRSSPAQGEFRDLKTAHASVRGDAVFEFADVGPHEITTFDMKQAARWTLRGAEGVSPVLIWGAENSSIGVALGTVLLDRVHVILPPEQTGPGFRVGPATLAIRNSTLTHLGASASEVIVVEGTGHVLLEDTVVRSCGTCRSVVLKGERSSLVTGQSLLIAGNASTIQIDSKDGVSDTRQVTLVTTACLSGQAGIACHHAGKQPPTCEFRLQQSALAYLPGHSVDAVGVLFSGWPKTAEALDRPRVPFVTWTVEKSAFVGWPHWIQLGFSDGTEPVDVPDETAWRTFWRQVTPTGVLIPEGADLRAVMEAGAMVTSEQIQIALAGIKTQLADAGPKWSALPEPPQPILAHVIAVSQRPSIPTSLDSPDPGTTLRFDLKKPHLGKFINSEECPDGSTVIAFGSGLRTIDPFVVQQKRVQVVFEQSEGTPLIIQPGYKTEPNAVSPKAWFSVEDGQLTLSHGSFRMSSSKTRTYPERFLQMTGGLAAIRRCRVEGIDAAWPIIDMHPSGGHAPPQLLIDQSLIAGVKSLVRVGAAESVIEVRGSILSASLGVAVALDAGSAGSQCVLNGSTLTAAKSVFQVLPVGEGGPVQLYSRATVYQGGGVLSLETDASAVQWWGFENAYSSGMQTFLLTKSSTGPQNFTSDWVHGWGAGHELLPVFGTNSTLLPSPPSIVADVAAESFQLHADCVAAQAGPTGQGLGAVVAQVGPPRVAPVIGPKTPPKGTPVKPLTNNPGF